MRNRKLLLRFAILCLMPLSLFSHTWSPKQYGLGIFPSVMLRYAHRKIHENYKPIQDYRFDFSPVFPRDDWGKIQELINRLWSHDILALDVISDFNGCMDDCPVIHLIIWRVRGKDYIIKDQDSWNSTMRDSGLKVPQGLLQDYAQLAFLLINQSASRFSGPYQLAPGDTIIAQTNKSVIVTFPVEFHWSDWGGHSGTDKYKVKVEFLSNGQVRKYHIENSNN